MGSKASTEARALKQTELLRLEGVAGTIHIDRALRQAGEVRRVIVQQVFDELPEPLRADYLRAERLYQKHITEARNANRNMGREFRKERLS